MKRLPILIFAVMIVGNILSGMAMAQDKDAIGGAVTQYFEEMFTKLKTVADEAPDENNFRKIMKPVAENTEGFYGATLINPDFIIRQVYYPKHFLARGFDLKNVNELKDFYKKIKESPTPQLSEPQSLIAMRYPVIKEGRLENIVSMMVRTESFLRATGLNKCKAFKIICLGKLAWERGRLSKDYEKVKLNLPSTEWIIQYEK